MKELKKDILLIFSLNARNVAGYTANPDACGWAGAVIEKVTRTFGQEQ